MVSEVPGLTVGVARPGDGHAVVAAVGELDFAGAAKLHPILLDAVAFSATVLDLRACTFCDSSGLRTILEAARQAEQRGGSFCLAGVGPSVARVLELAGVDAFLRVFPNVETALKA